MEAIHILIWIIAIICGAILLQIIGFRVKTKFTLYWHSREIKNMANKYEGKTKEDLLAIADKLKKFSKEEKLFHPLKEEEVEL